MKCPTCKKPGYTPMPKKTIQIAQQEIRSLIENFDWETNPQWENNIDLIKVSIFQYWKYNLKR